ncbi:VRR-NUC domain-containing protein [Arthrobacter sp. MP_2.3]|uniref:VRR-NUC domain-containing protein n=1 Tax=Arthrobacter sp. MP_2.3 TaxID=3349633 RepID=UPI0038D4D491
MPSKHLSSHNSLTESQFQQQVIELAQLHGYGLCYHTHDSRRSEPGFPDLVLISNRRERALFRELKTAKGKVSKDQLIWITSMQLVGLNAGVWRPEDLTNGHIISDLRGDE